MASNPENVRLTVLMKLQEALDEESILEEQMLALMHRFADRFMDRRVEINNLIVLHDHPLIDYGKYALGCMAGADIKKYVELKGVWRGVRESEREKGKGRGVTEKQHGLAEDSTKEIDRGKRATSNTPNADMNMENLNAELNRLGNNSGKPTKDRVDIAMHSNVESPKHECVIPSVVDIMVEKEKLSSLDDTTVMGSFPPLSTLGATMTGNAPGKSSYANINSKPSRKKVNVRTLFTPKGNVIDVVILVDFIRAISERFSNTTYGYFLGKKVAYPVVANYVKLYGVPAMAFSEDGLSAIAIKLGTPIMLDSYTSHMCMQSWGSSSYARVMIELQADVELKIALSWLCLKLLGRPLYIPVPKKTIDSSIGDKKKGVKPTIEVSNSNPFYVLNLVDNDEDLAIDGQAILVDKAGNPLKSLSGTKKQAGLTRQETSISNPFDVLNVIENNDELGTNGENLKLAEKGANPDVVSSAHETSSEAFGSPNTTPLVARINDLERKMLDEKLVLLDDDEKPLKMLMIWLMRIVIVKWTRRLMKLQVLWHRRVLRLKKALKVVVVTATKSDHLSFTFEYVLSGWKRRDGEEPGAFVYCVIESGHGI
nr:hypothetical protein [Tanacetum cinerariifolium]